MSAKAAKGIRIERSDGLLLVSVRTYRAGDFVHVVFGSILLVFGGLVLWIGASNGTLLRSWATLPLIASCFAYFWFALTRVINRRSLLLTADRLTVSTGPLPSLARGLHMPFEQLGKPRTRRQRRWIPPIWFRDVYHVEAGGVPRRLFGNLDLEEDASGIAAAMTAFRAQVRGVSN